MLAAIASLIAVLLGIGAIFAGFASWRAHRTPDVTRVLVDVRAFFYGATATGGARTPDFLEPQRQATELELGDLVDAVHDRELRRAIVRLLDAYKKAWASAPPYRVPIGWGSGTSNPANQQALDDQKMFLRQRQAIDDGLSAIEDAMKRVNRLERFTVRKG